MWSGLVGPFVFYWRHSGARSAGSRIRVAPPRLRTIDRNKEDQRSWEGAEARISGRAGF